jgi:hypothetical protein
MRCLRVRKLRNRLEKERCEVLKRMANQGKQEQIYIRTAALMKKILGSLLHLMAVYRKASRGHVSENLMG